MAITDEHRWPCEQCGAQLRYAPGQTELTCSHCGHVQKITRATQRTRTSALAEHDLAKGLRDELPAGDMVDVRTTSCPNCGAQVEFVGASHATLCPFCASPVVVDTGTLRHIKPQALVPFQLTEDKAREAMVRWMGSLWFAPGTLLEYARKGRAMSGIYVPFWTFDASTRSRYSGQRGDYYYETRSVNVRVNGRVEQRQERVRHVRWHPASGRVARDFDDVLIMGSTSVPSRLGNELTPWDLSMLVPYEPDYLAGFQAEGYTVSLSDGNRQAKSRMASIIEGDVRRAIGGDEQRVTDVATSYSDETFRHVLLPVWTAAYKYNGKSFRFLVNGQTGEVQGERPWSIWKIGFATLLVAILVFVAFYLSDPEAMGLDRLDWLE